MVNRRLTSTCHDSGAETGKRLVHMRGRRLALSSRFRYNSTMSHGFRCILTVLLALTFAVGPAPQCFRTSATLKIETAVQIEKSGSAQCHCCDNDQTGVTADACCALCGTAAALPSTDMTFEQKTVEAFEKFVAPRTVGLAISPDPHPPRRLA